MDDFIYIEYVVKSGDTLYSIAKEYGSTVNDIIDANTLVGTMIYPNQVLEIPVKKPEPMISYQVKTGDTIEKIAKQFSISPYELGKYNDFGKLTLCKDQILIIPNQTGTYEIRVNDDIDTILATTKRDIRHLVLLNQDDWLKPEVKLKSNFLPTSSLTICYKYYIIVIIEK